MSFYEEYTLDFTESESLAIVYEDSTKGIYFYNYPGYHYPVVVTKDDENIYDVREYNHFNIQGEYFFSPQLKYSLEENILYGIKRGFLYSFDFGINKKDTTNTKTLYWTDEYQMAYYNENFWVVTFDGLTEIITLEALEYFYDVDGLLMDDVNKTFYFGDNIDVFTCNILIYNYTELLDTIEINGSCGSIISNNETEFVIEVINGDSTSYTIPK